MKLYIIGNGFDLHHGLKTRYLHFAYYLQNNYSELYENLIKYFGLPDVYEDEPDKDDYLWNYFESKLSDLDTELAMEEASEYAPNVASDDYRDRDLHAMEQVNETLVNQLTTGMISAFKEFILQVEFPATIDGRTLRIDPHSLFLNFNYTKTLELYYDIPKDQICYLHGNAQMKDDKLVLGHGVDPTEFEEAHPQPPANLSEEDLDQWRQDRAEEYDYSYDTSKQRLISYFLSSFKKTDEVMETHRNFFEKLDAMDEVIVLGHSLSDVDWAYLLKVKASVRPDATWSASYHNPSEGPDRRKQLIELGVDKNQIQIFQLTGLMA